MIRFVSKDDVCVKWCKRKKPGGVKTVWKVSKGLKDGIFAEIKMFWGTKN